MNVLLGTYICTYCRDVEKILRRSSRGPHLRDNRWEKREGKKKGKEKKKKKKEKRKEEERRGEKKKREGEKR